MPSSAMPKESYTKAVAAAVRRASTRAIRAGMLKCKKLTPLQQQTRSGAECNQWLKLEDIRLVVRAKLSCLTQFQADFGMDSSCECGHRLTFLHVAMENNSSCTRWREVRTQYPERWDNDTQLLHFTQKVLQSIQK